MSDNDSEFGSFLAGFVIGGLVGAAVALVLAPQSGADTRSQITGKGNELRTNPILHVEHFGRRPVEGLAGHARLRVTNGNDRCFVAHNVKVLIIWIRARITTKPLNLLGQ